MQDLPEGGRPEPSQAIPDPRTMLALFYSAGATQAIGAAPSASRRGTRGARGGATPPPAGQPPAKLDLNLIPKTP